MEPASTAGAWIKVAEVVKNWPLWLFVGVASSLTVFVVVPDFRELASPSIRTYVWLAMVIAWILAASRAAGPASLAWRARIAASEARVKFIATPIEHQCFWSVSKQADGSFLTQVACHFMVKNRTGAPLHLMTAKLIGPRIKGVALPELLTMQAVDSRVHGTAYVSGHSIPAQGTLPVSAMIFIRGVPKQKYGMMDATIEIADADANRERVRVKVMCLCAEVPG